MHHFDVFNGDADGLCALHQLRLAEPIDGELITGVKRHIHLLARVSGDEGDSITVFDSVGISCRMFSLRSTSKTLRYDWLAQELNLFVVGRHF